MANIKVLYLLNLGEDYSLQSSKYKDISSFSKLEENNKDVK